MRCSVKFRLKIDDSLDVFAVHGVGGILGSLLVGVLALGAFGGGGLAEGQTVGGQLGVQALGVGVTLVWSAVLTVPYPEGDRRTDRRPARQ